VSPQLKKRVLALSVFYSKTKWIDGNAIQSKKEVFIFYPHETKIMELCHIGYNQRHNQR